LPVALSLNAARLMQMRDLREGRRPRPTGREALLDLAEDATGLDALLDLAENTPPEHGAAGPLAHDSSTATLLPAPDARPARPPLAELNVDERTLLQRELGGAAPAPGKENVPPEGLEALRQGREARAAARRAPGSPRAPGRGLEGTPISLAHELLSGEPASAAESLEGAPLSPGSVQPPAAVDRPDDERLERVEKLLWRALGEVRGSAGLPRALQQDIETALRTAQQLSLQLWQRQARVEGWTERG